MCGQQDGVAVFAPGGEREVIGGTDVSLAHQFLGRPAEGHVPHHPFDKLTGTDILI